MAGLLLCVDSLLIRCYLLVSGSVRVRARVMARVRDRVTVRTGIGFTWCGHTSSEEADVTRGTRRTISP